VGEKYTTVVERWLHNIVIFHKFGDEKIKVSRYLVPKSNFAMLFFMNDFPNHKVVHYFHLMSRKHKLEKNKYYALYKEAKTIQARIQDAEEAWRTQRSNGTSTC